MATQDLSPEEQKKIIAQFKEDKEVFKRVYDFYYEMILHYLAKRTLSSEVAYDLTAETFIKAFENFHRFEYRSISIKAWIYRIAINTLKNSYREPQCSALGEMAENHPSLVTEIKEELNELDEALFGESKLLELNHALSKLNPRYQNIISLYYFSEMSQEEIARTMNRSSGAIKAMMHRAMENLRAMMTVK